MDNVQPKRIVRPPKDGEARMVQTALRMPIDLFKFYHEFDDPACPPSAPVRQIEGSR